MVKPARIVLFIIGFLTIASGLQAQVGSTFSRGRSRLSISGGYGNFNDHQYGVVGVGAGYYFFDGFEAGVDGEAWLGDKPHIYTVSPEARYIVTQFESFRPYIGGFYKRTFYDSLDNTHSVGGRAGIISALSEHAYLSAGLVVEHIYDCNQALYDSCSQVYPEVGLSFSY
jgi:hypothetical protein